MRALVIRFSSLGDILLQTPFVSWLKMGRPDMKISFLTLKGNESLILGHPHIDEVLTYEKKKGLADVGSLFNFTRTELAKRKFDVVIDLHGTNRAFLVKSFLPGVVSLSMDKRRIERWLLVKFKIDLLKNQGPGAIRNLEDLAFAFNGEYDKEELSLFLKEAFENKGLGVTTSSVTLGSKSPEVPMVCVCPGASFAAKRWPVGRFKGLVKKLLEKTEWNVKVLAGPEDDFCEIFNELEELYPTRFQNLQGKLSLRDSMKEVAASSLCVGNDSVMGHVAESCGVPSYVIFGPTSESFGFAPHLPDSKSFSTDSVWCRPCSTTGSRKCFRKKHYCMLATTEDQVLGEAIDLLKRKHV